jgi:outer membrane protein assembly factor BamD
MFKKLYFIVIPLILFFGIIACSSSNKALKEIPFGEVELLFKKANELIQAGEYDDARKFLERVKAEDASQEYAPLAQLRIADTYFAEEEYEEAEVEYDSFLQRYTYHTYAPYAQYRLGMTYFKRIGSVDVSYSMARKALTAFEELLKKYPRNPYVEATERRIRSCRNVLAEYEFYVGRFYFKKGSYRAAIGRFETILRNYPDSRPEAEALYYIGLSYKKMGNPEKSIEAFNALIEKFPHIKLSNKARKIIASLNSKS